MSIEVCGESDSDYGFYTTCEHKEMQHHDLSDLFEEQMQYLLVSNTGKAGASAEAGVRLNWGDKEKGRFNGYVEAECHDKNGNQVKGRADQNSDGSGSASISGKVATKERPN